MSLIDAESTSRELRLFRAIADTTRDFLFVFDLNCRFIYANRSLLELWGKTAEQAMGKGLAELGYEPWQAERHAAEVRQVITTKRPVQGEVPFTGGSGLKGVYDYIFSPVLDSSGNVEIVIGTARDVADRKRAEERSGTILESITDAFFGLDADWRFIYVNKQAGRILNRDPSSLIGKVLWEEYPGLHGSEFERVYHAAARDRVSGTVTAFYPDHNRHYEVHVYPGEPSGVAIYFRNVTERIRIENDLRDREKHLRMLTDTMPQMVWVTRPDGSHEYFNRRWYEFTGLPDGAGDGDAWLDVVHPADRDAARERWKKSLHSGEPYEKELRLKNAQGEYRWALARAVAMRDDRGNVARWYGACADIQDQKNTEQALRDSQRQMELVVKGANVGVWYCPLPFDRLIWDEKVKEHFHLAPDAEVTIETFYERLHPDDRERTRQSIEQSIALRQAYDIDYRTVSPDGRHVKWIRASGRGFYDASGSPERFDGITIDISERVRIEERIRQANAEKDALLESERAARTDSEHASRMKDEFLATLSHELRTPLNAILGWAQILRRSPRPDDVAEGIEIIERNARVQTQIIEDLLDMSRIISGKIRLDVQRLDLATVVRAAVETVRPAADAKGIRLQIVLDPASGPVSGDPNRLQQVFWNLLTNAIKFTPKGGRVQVLLERVNSHLEVSVIDTGEGIAPEFLPFVFDRFRQADASTTRRHGGLGLGLAIVRQLVELHGGTVRVRSDGKGFGSSFTVTLPLTVLRANEGDRRHPTLGATFPMAIDTCVEIEGLKVLVVDDEPDARALVKRMLEDCHAIVTTASSVREAIAHIEANKPDVLISDIGMPQEDGFALIRHVRSLGNGSGKRLPAIALTAYARAEDRMKVMLAGFDQHLVKPVEPAELVTVVAVLSGRARR